MATRIRHADGLDPKYGILDEREMIGSLFFRGHLFISSVSLPPFAMSDLAYRQDVLARARAKCSAALVDLMQQVLEISHPPLDRRRRGGASAGLVTPHSADRLPDGAGPARPEGS